MLVEETDLHFKTKHALKKAGYQTIDEVADAYVEMGNTAFSSKRLVNTLLPFLYKNGFLEKLPSHKELEEKVGSRLLGIKDAAETVGMDPETLFRITKSGKISRDCYYVRGIDVITRAHNIIYLYHEENFLSLFNKYSSLTSISKELNTNQDQLWSLLNKKLNTNEIERIRLAPQHWDKDWILDNYLSLIQKRSEDKRGNGANYSELFSDELNNLIEEYFDYRLKNDEISFEGIAHFTQKFKKKSTVDDLKVKLIRYLYKILCGRAGIENFWKKEGNFYRSLTIEEETKLLAVVFDPLTFDEIDAKNMVAGINSENTRWKHAAEIKPFLYFALMNAEDEYYNNLDKKDSGILSDFDGIAEKEKLFRQKRRIDKSLKTDIPVKPPKKVKSANKKVFATRIQLAEIFQKIWLNKLSHQLRSSVKCSVMILIGFLAGVRPVELWKLEIDKHLDIEKDPSHPEFGLLKKYHIKRQHGMHADFYRTSIDDPNGWSRLWVSEDISKGTYSPSPEYGTLLVPKLVDAINHYLKWVYKKSPSQFKGKGFLFRADVKNPFLEYSQVISLTKWIWKVKKDFTEILNEDEIKNFSYYETRHTVNNLIANRTLIDDPQLNDWKKRVAEIHCRHEIGDDNDKSKSRINEFHYQEDVPLWVYYSIIKDSLDFPFSINKLIEWEKVHNPLGVFESNDYEERKPKEEKFVPPTKQEINTDVLSDEQKMKINAANANLEKLNAEYEIVKHPVKAKNKFGLEGKERRIRLSKLKQEMEQLEEQKSIIAKGEAS
jgi:hypothetical protein